MSAVIAAYNARAYVQQAVDSLRAQAGVDLEVVVVDDGSTDGTLEVLQRLSDADSRVRVFPRCHAGVISALNLGAAQARAEYLAWLGADDVALPGRLVRQVTYLDANPRVAAVGGDVVAVDSAHGRQLAVCYPASAARVRNALRESNPLAAPAVTMRADVYRQLGGCRAAFANGAEDYDLWLRMAERYDLANLSAPVVRYRVHADQASRRRAQEVVLGTVAARLSAALRARRRPDPFDAGHHVTYDMLRAAQPDRHVVDSMILEAAAGASMFQLLMGHHAEALRLLTWAEEVGRGVPLARRARARAHLVRAAAAWSTRRLDRASLEGAAALASHPAVVAALCASALRMLVGNVVGRRASD